MTIEEAKALKDSLITGRTTYTIDPALYEEYRGLPLRVISFNGTKEELLSETHKATRANNTDPGTLVFCEMDGIIAKRTSVMPVNDSNPLHWWVFYGDITEEDILKHIKWHTLEIPI